MKINIDKTTKNTIILYSGIIINILLGWVITKLNTSFLTVEDYGKYAFYINAIYYSRIVFLFGTFESASRLLAINYHKNDRKEIFGATLLFSLFIILLYSTFFRLASPVFSYFEVNITNIAILFSPFIGLLIIQTFILGSLKGTEQMGLLSFGTFAPRLFYVFILGFVIFLYDFTLKTTLYSFYGGMLCALGICIIMIGPSFRNFKFRIKQLLNQIKSYGVHVYSGNILSETVFHSDKFVISYFLNDESMAYYGLAFMLTFPISHFSTSMATTLFNKFVSQKEIYPRALKMNMLVIVLTVLVFILLRRPIVYYLFSPQYLPSVTIMLPLAIAFGFYGLSKPYVLFLMAQGRGKLVRNIMIVISIVSISLNLIFVPIFGLYGAAWSALIAYMLDYVLYMIAYVRMVKNYRQSPTRE